MARKKKNIRHETKFVKCITVIDPDTGGECEVEIRKDIVSGALVGLDGSWLAQLDGDTEDDDNHPLSPYDAGVVLVVPDDENSESEDVFVDRVTKLATDAGLTAAELIPLLGVEADRINNGGISEVLRLVVAEGDDLKWVETLIVDRIAEKRIDASGKL